MQLYSIFLFFVKVEIQLLQRKRNMLQNILLFIAYSYSGMFQEVGEFVVDNSGKHKLFLNNESIVWPNNLTAPSSGIPKCKACDEHCYNGEAIVIFCKPLTSIFPGLCYCAHSAVTPTDTACLTACDVSKTPGRQFWSPL